MIAVDFSKGQEIYPQLEEQLRDLDIGVLGRKTLWIWYTCIKIQRQ